MRRKAPRVTEPPADAPLVLGEFLPYRISVLAERVSRLFADRYEAEFGLGIGEWRVLAVLGETSPRSTREVIATTGMDRVRVSRAVTRLVDRGLLESAPLPGDARARRLRPTPRGGAVYRRIVPRARDLQAALDSALSERERGQLDDILAKLAARVARLDAAGVGRAPADEGGRGDGGGGGCAGIDKEDPDTN